MHVVYLRQACRHPTALRSFATHAAAPVPESATLSGCRFALYLDHLLDVREGYKLSTAF